jgi:hypothetical protein
MMHELVRTRITDKQAIGTSSMEKKKEGQGGGERDIQIGGEMEASGNWKG